MKSKRLQYKYRDNASKLHKAVGNRLHNVKGLWSQYKIYQEYPVNKINKKWSSGRHKFDWVILDLKLVIECHGEQHFKPVAFDGDEFAAKQRFILTVETDRLKKQAAEEIGFSYVTITDKNIKQFDEILTEVLGR